MKLILNIYGQSVVMHVKLIQGAISYRGIIAHWVPKCLMILSFLSNNFVSNGWTFMKHIEYIYNHDVALHVKFHQGVFSYRGAFAL